MRISVIVPDRTIVVDGLAVTFEGALPDDSVRTLQYDTAAVEGIIGYVDQRHEPIRDPAIVAPWVAIWGYALTAKVEAATREGIATDERYAVWKSVEAARAQAEQDIIRKAAEEIEAATAGVEAARAQA
ncbi:hypothetical protein OIU35_31620 [Boseaceae bacterium BT-24-1]|nr:hypothetical protein [Boseaceae bacterium BT-24-1]